MVALRPKLFTESSIRRWATSARPWAPPARSTRAGQVRAAAEDQVERREQGQGEDRSGRDQQHGPAPPACPGGDGRGDRGPGGQHDHRADVGAEATEAEDESRDAAGGEKGDRPAAPRQILRRGSPGGQRRADPHRYQHRQRRLELVADAEEAHPDRGVGAEQRELGQRRADRSRRARRRRRSARRRPRAPRSRGAARRSPPRAAARRGRRRAARPCGSARSRRWRAAPAACRRR